MSDYKIIRNDPNWSEPLDEEIIPLTDVLNEIGVVTISSCSGHGSTWPYVFFEHSTDERIEDLARYIKRKEDYDYAPYYTVWEKEIMIDGYRWSVAVHLNDVYHNTPSKTSLQKAVVAISEIRDRILEWYNAHSATDTLKGEEHDRTQIGTIFFAGVARKDYIGN
jgi:hypothetical protein